MKQIKVSANYWNSLTATQQKVFRELVGPKSIQYTKRVITLASKHFPTFTDIIPLMRLIPELPVYLTGAGNVSIVFENGTELGSIYKSYGIGITERVDKYENGDYIEIWHN